MGGVDDAPSAESTTNEVQLGSHEGASMLISCGPGWRTRCMCPLPPSVAMPCKTVCFAKSLAVSIATSTQKQQAVASRRRAGIHARGWLDGCRRTVVSET